MAKFILLFHNDVGMAAPSPEAYKAVLQDFYDWAAGLRAKDALVSGHKLMEEPGRSMVKTGGTVQVMDGPFAETKELIGGLVIVEAPDYDDAVELARACPQLKYGGRIEVRQIDEEH